MSRASRNGSGFFHIEYSSAFTAAAHAAHQEAVAAGRGAEFLSALRQIVRDIEMDPGLAGDPLFPMPGAGLIMYVISRRPVVVYYMADPHRQVLWPMAVRSMA